MFSVAQLSALGSRLERLSSGGLLPAASLSALLEQLSMGSFDAAEPPLPVRWRPLGAPAYAKLAAGLSAGEPPLVAWRAVVATLAAVARPSTEALLAMLEGGARAAGRLELLGEEPQPPEIKVVPEGEEAEVEVEVEVEEAEKEEGPAPLRLSREQYDALTLWFEAAEEVPEQAELKSSLFDLFAPDGSLDLPKLLLYFCDDAAKAFSVVGFLRAPSAGEVNPKLAQAARAMLSKRELSTLLHRDAPLAKGVAQPDHADPWSAAALDRLWGEVGLDEEELMAHAHMARHPLGRAMLDACKAYRRTDPYGLVASLHAKAQNALKM